MRTTSQTLAPRLHAAGEPQARVSTHVGYAVGHAGVRPDTDKMLLGGLGVVFFWCVAPCVLYCTLRRPRLGVPLLLCWVVGMGLARWVTEESYRIDPAYLDALVQLERFSATIETEAAALGHWPDLHRWTVTHQPGARERDIFVYSAQRVETAGREPWAALSVCADNVNTPGRPFIHYYPKLAMDSRYFGPDGLYGTPDDEPRLARALNPRRHWRRDWPHGRPPRNPSVKLPEPP